jgi:hypothetical protein
VPGTLERPILQQVALRHRKVLVGTDIAQGRYPAVVPDQADRVTSRADALQNRSFGELPKGSDWLEGRFFVCSNEWKTARCAHF